MSKRIALIGNPNVGKSTIFNYLTNSKQHTGNWAGKTVENAQAKFVKNNEEYILFDLPGIYSLSIKSHEEKVARDLLIDSNFDIAVVVCDATQLLRGINLLLQVLELKENVVLCVNMLDEAKKKGLIINFEKLSKLLNVPVIPTEAKSKESLENFRQFLIDYQSTGLKKITYSKELELAIIKIEKNLNINNKRWYAIKLLEHDNDIIKRLNYQKDIDTKYISCFSQQLNNKSILITNQVLKRTKEIKQSKLDKFLTSKLTGIPFMIFLFLVLFWLTINGANYPSELLYKFFNFTQIYLLKFCHFLCLPNWLVNPLIFGIYKTLTWVVAVMLPPMMIFFPLFSLLENLGILPRIAFNLDHFFQKCQACGKQALTMCMGLGCNAVGVTGCRIIDSKRERLIAIITNSLMPCNGKFSAMISIITMFFIGFSTGLISTFYSALILIGFILISILFTFLVSYILSKTLLKGKSSSFILELPSYRKPKIIKTILVSLYDKAIVILWRAIKVSAPAGLVIWLFANIKIGDSSILSICSNFLEPFGNLLGLDGVIILAFILGFPANEIVIPLIIMGYMSLGNLTNFNDLLELKHLLITNNWTILTAINFMILILFHYPCSTTLLTIKEETKSIYWTFISFITPLIIGIGLCLLTNLIFNFIV